MYQIVINILEFVIVFLLVYIGIYIFSYRRLKEYNRKTAITGVKYLYYKYKLDITKIGYKRICKTLMFSDSFIVSFLFLITKIVNNIYIRLLVCAILIFPLFAFVYHLVYKYYEKESVR